MFYMITLNQSEASIQDPGHVITTHDQSDTSSLVRLSLTWNLLLSTKPCGILRAVKLTSVPWVANIESLYRI